MIIKTETTLQGFGLSRTSASGARSMTIATEMVADAIGMVADQVGVAMTEILILSVILGFLYGLRDGEWRKS